MTKLSIELEQYFSQKKLSDDIRLVDLLELAGKRVFGFLFVILSLPSALPVPAPGYSIPFGILILILACQFVLGTRIPWFPKKLLNSSIKLGTAQAFFQKSKPWLQRIELLARPRMTYICTNKITRIFIGLIIIFMSISMMIPIPGTNTLPAIGIFVTGFGLQEDDGCITFLGLIVCSIASVLSASILMVAIWSGSTLIEVLKGYLTIL